MQAFTACFHRIQYFLALSVAKKIRLAVIFYADWQKFYVDESSFKEGILADNAALGFFTPFLVKDKIAVCVADKFIHVNFDRLDPVRMISQYDICSRINGYMR